MPNTNRDGLDNYNDNLSKRAVNSIFNNIEFNNSNSDENTEDEFDDNYTIDTNFNIKSTQQRRQLVSDVFADDDVAPKRKPKNARPTRLGEASPNPISSKKQLTSNNSAFTSDDDTLYNKNYVTRGNHVAVTPAMAAKRKNKTMMESQRIPTVTDEEIAAYKSSISLSDTGSIDITPTANTPVVAKQQQPVDYERYITREQKEIYDYLQSEIQRKKTNIENTMHRMNEKTKHYNEIIESTNKKYNNAVNNSTLENNSYTDDDYQPINQPLNQTPSTTDTADFIDYTKVDNTADFENSNIDIDDNLDISYDDLDQDFEDTVASNYGYQEKPTRQSRPLIPTNDLSAPKAKVRRGNDAFVRNQDSNTLSNEESDTYSTKQNKFNTGEVSVINDTVTTEIALEDLDELVFDNYDTTDMEFLRKAIKEKSQARKMQVLEEQFSEFEKKHRDFGNKNVPPRTTSRPKPNKPENHNPDTSTRESYVKERSRAHHNDDFDFDTALSNTSRIATQKEHSEQNYNSYEYRKAQRAQNSHEDEDYNTGRHNTSHSGRHNTVNTNTGRYNTAPHTNTGRYNTAHTGRIPPTHTSRITTVDLDNEYDDVDDYSKKFNTSLIFNIVLVIFVLGLSTYSFLKVSTLSEEVESLRTANAELVEQNNKINELQIDVDYYKDLYQNTEEGKASLEAERKAEAGNQVESTDPSTSTETSSTDTPSTASGKTYTVQSGDTLSSISKKFYGTSSEYKKIMEANKLTSENVSIGQELIIP